jgi:hypothetical protein
MNSDLVKVSGLEIASADGDEAPGSPPQTKPRQAPQFLSNRLSKTE